MRKSSKLVHFFLLILFITGYSQRSSADQRSLQSTFSIYENPDTTLLLDISKGENRKVEYWMKAGGTNPAGVKLDVNSLYWTREGKPWIPVMGEFHYVRFPESGWEEQLMKMKAAGINIISTYVFWVNAEPVKGEWDWVTKDNNLRKFIQLCAKHGLYVWLRPGPYINAESKNGGLPDWINKKGKRSDAPWYIEEVRKYYAQVADQTRGLFYKDGGPIIGLQVDNEFAHGDAKHLATLLSIAQEFGMVAPFNTCTNNSKYDYPKGDLIPLQGAYPYRGWGGPVPTTDYLYSTDEWGAMQNIGGLPYDGTKFPRGMAELGVGCWMNYNQRFVVPVYDSEGHLQNCIGRGVNLPGYYMFQGGTQHAGTEAGGMPLSYDFQAPLGEYGQLNPSYHALKRIHYFLNDFGDRLAPMQPVRPEHMVLDPNNTRNLRYVGRFNGNSGFIFMTTTQCWVDMKPIENVQIRLKLKDQELLFPDHPITIPANCSPIFPVNFDLNGVNLIYSTAQLFAGVTKEGVPHFFFFAVDGIQPEFVLETGTISGVQGADNREENSRYTRITPVPSTGKAITLTSANGKKAVIVLLTEKEAEKSWRVNPGGQEKLILAPGSLVNEGRNLLLRTSSAETSIAVFPAVGRKSKEGAKLFDQRELKGKFKASPVRSQQIADNEWKIEIEKLAPGTHDLFLQVDYTGTGADLYVDGVKYSDDWYNGKIWTIGVKRFLDGKPHTLTIRVNPWDDKVKGVAPDKIPVGDKERKGLIRSVTIQPEYEFHLD